MFGQIEPILLYLSNVANDPLAMIAGAVVAVGWLAVQLDNLF